MLLLGLHHSPAKATRRAQKPGGLAIDVCIPVLLVSGPTVELRAWEGEVCGR